MTYNTKIFKYLPPKNNNYISKMNGIELQELFYYLENYYLVLRNTLNFTKDITFGLEIEVEDTFYHQINEKLKENKLWTNWIAKGDGSLEHGVEINSPILEDKRKNWQELATICNILREISVIDEHCGGHIHIGTQVLGEKKESWLNFIKLWSTYENIIYRFLYGEYLTARSTLKEFAPPIAKKLATDYKILTRKWKLKTEDIVTRICHERNQAINFYYVSNFTQEDYYNTIEFRCPNGTLDPVIWQNNVNLLINLLNYSKKTSFNDDIITKRQKQVKYLQSKLLFYDEIYLEQSLELCDLLFNNNLDKIYFLKQYLKSFETSNQIMKKCKTFTRNIKN